MSTAAAPVRVVVAEDHYLVREALRELLESEPEVALVALAEDRASLAEAIARERPDVVLTDISMPPSGGAEGIEVALELRGSHPDVGVVILSQYAEPAYALALFEAGSARRAYLLKERVANRGELVAAIRTVAAGGSVVDAKIVEGLIAERSRRADSQLRRLTSREVEVLREIATGKSNAAIAESLALNKRAVEKHINAIFSKLDLRDADDVSQRVKATLIYLDNAGED